MESVYRRNKSEKRKFYNKNHAHTATLLKHLGPLLNLANLFICFRGVVVIWCWITFAAVVEIFTDTLRPKPSISHCGVYTLDIPIVVLLPWRNKLHSRFLLFHMISLKTFNHSAYDEFGIAAMPTFISKSMHSIPKLCSLVTTAFKLELNLGSLRVTVFHDRY